MPKDVPLDDDEAEGLALYLARRKEARAAVAAMLARTGSTATVLSILGAIVGAIAPGTPPLELAA